MQWNNDGGSAVASELLSFTSETIGLTDLIKDRLDRKTS